MSKIIKLTQGKITIIDKEDYKKASIYKWCYQKSKNSGYAVTNIYPIDWKHPRKLYLHRLIIGIESNKIVDHINQDGLDNRRINLRIVNRSLNALNSGMYRHNTSGTRGVIWDCGVNKWLSQIVVNKKKIFLGRFNDIKEAILARKRAELKYIL